MSATQRSSSVNVNKNPWEFINRQSVRGWGPSFSRSALASIGCWSIFERKKKTTSGIGQGSCMKSCLGTKRFFPQHFTTSSFGVNKIKLIEQQNSARKPQSFPLISCSVYKTSPNPSQVACFYIRQKRHKPTVNHLHRKQSEIVSNV